MTATVEGSNASVRLAVAALVGAAVAVGLGVYGHVHTGTGRIVAKLFFSGEPQFKAWLATVAVTLAIVQLVTALRIYGKIKVPRQAPSWLGDLHRLTGTLAFLFSLPVAYHCLWSIGFNAKMSFTRVFVHSVLGCFFYGAFAAKILIVRTKHLPNWTLPVVGGLVFSALVGVWFTSAWWFFTTNLGVPKL